MLQLYVQHQGDMDAITASALCCTQEDEPRICSIIQAAIDSRDVKAFPAFARESEKKKKARRKRVRNGKGCFQLVFNWLSNQHRN